jgi:hypothetical protein
VDSLCGPASLQRIHEYERVYTGFWQTQAGAQLAAWRGVPGCDRTLIECLRREVHVARKRVLDAGASLADQQTLEELRRPSGDTARWHRPGLGLPAEPAWR